MALERANSLDLTSDDAHLLTIASLDHKRLRHVTQVLADAGCTTHTVIFDKIEFDDANSRKLRSLLLNNRSVRIVQFIGCSDTDSAIQAISAGMIFSQAAMDQLESIRMQLLTNQDANTVADAALFDALRTEIQKPEYHPSLERILVKVDDEKPFVIRTPPLTKLRGILAERHSPSRELQSACLSYLSLLIIDHFQISLQLKFILKMTDQKWEVSLAKIKEQQEQEEQISDEELAMARALCFKIHELFESSVDETYKKGHDFRNHYFITHLFAILHFPPMEAANNQLASYYFGLSSSYLNKASEDEPQASDLLYIALLDCVSAYTYAKFVFEKITDPNQNNDVEENNTVEQKFIDAKLSVQSLAKKGADRAFLDSLFDYLHTIAKIVADICILRDDLAAAEKWLLESMEQLKNINDYAKQQLYSLVMAKFYLLTVPNRDKSIKYANDALDYALKMSGNEKYLCLSDTLTFIGNFSRYSDSQLIMNIATFVDHYILGTIINLEDEPVDLINLCVVFMQDLLTLIKTVNESHDFAAAKLFKTLLTCTLNEYKNQDFPNSIFTYYFKQYPFAYKTIKDQIDALAIEPVATLQIMLSKLPIVQSATYGTLVLADQLAIQEKTIQELRTENTAYEQRLQQLEATVNALMQSHHNDEVSGEDSDEKQNVRPKRKERADDTPASPSKKPKVNENPVPRNHTTFYLTPPNALPSGAHSPPKSPTRRSGLDTSGAPR